MADLIDSIGKTLFIIAAPPATAFIYVIFKLTFSNPEMSLEAKMDTASVWAMIVLAATIILFALFNYIHHQRND